MPPTVKAVQLLVNESLPEDVRDYSRSYSKSSINELMTQIADKHPDNYAELVDTLKDLGRHASYYQGETLRLKDFKPLFDKAPIIDAMDKELAIAKSTIKDQKKLKKTTSDILGKYTIGLEKLTLDAAKNLKEDNNLYNAVVSGARGSNTQLKAIVTTPGTFTDLKGEIIPLFSRKSYGEGLSLGSFLASSYGLRQSTVTIKRGTATGGAAGKKFARAMTPFVVTRKQDLSDNGIDLPIDDDSLYGRVLARPAAGFPRGTVVDRDVLNTLKKSNLKHVIVHSPIATVSGEGISAEAFGYDYNKQLPSVGSHVGITVGQALGEPITQMALSCLKHDTLVKMADGTVKQIKDLKVGDKVLGADKQGNTFPVEVKNVFDQGLQPCNKYVYSNGSITENTEDHKFLNKDSLVDQIKNMDSVLSLK